jgi:hypothetical protein
MSVRVIGMKAAEPVGMTSVALSGPPATVPGEVKAVAR